MDLTLLFAVNIFITVFTCILIPIYWKRYGITNFLWLSDIGLFLTVLTLWFNSSLLNSMAVIGILPMELIWCVDYFYRLFTNKKLLGIADYMFDEQYSLFLRALSLFHIVLPIIWIWLLIYWGYNEQALIYQTVFFWLIILTTYFFTKPQDNINWVFYPTVYHWRLPQPIWVALLLVTVPVLFFLPLHILFIRI